VSAIPWHATDADYEESFPWIKWREPVHVLVPGVGSGWACRLCIAKYGLEGRNADALWRTPADVEVHLAEFHPVPE
jgi:hypothetical protein